MPHHQEIHIDSTDTPLQVVTDISIYNSLLIDNFIQVRSFNTTYIQCKIHVEDSIFEECNLILIFQKEIFSYYTIRHTKINTWFFFLEQ